MNHQPFEDWIFEDTLLEDQRIALKQHIATCNECRHLSEAAKGVDWLFNQSSDLEPAPGFSLRWQKLAENRVQREQQLAAWVVFSSLLAVAGSIVLVNFGALWFENINLYQMFVAGVVRAINQTTIILEWFTAIQFFISAIPVGITRMVGISLGALATFWVSIWVVALRKITAGQRREA